MRLVSNKVAVLPLFAFASALVLQGCAGGVSSRDAGGYDAALARGDYKGAAQMATAGGEISPDGSSKNLLWSLYGGVAMLQDGQGPRSVGVFDHVEAMMQERDLTRLDASGQYRAKTYDRVMVNGYKALAFLQAGNSDMARTELLRADERQKNAEEEYSKEAAEAQAKADQNGADVGVAMRSVQTDAAYQQVSREMGQFGGYAPFINPFATYLTGLYFLNARDANMERARGAFARVRGMVGPSPLLNGDYDLAAKGQKFTPRTWVIFENGQGSTLDEYSLQIPIPVVGRRGGVSLVRVALPRLHENAAAASGLLVGEGAMRTSVVGNFDYVQRSEFQRRYRSIVTAAIAEVALKAVAQNLAAQEKTGIALLVTQVASQVSTADTRSWSALPKDFQAARIDAPKDGKVRLRTVEGADIGTATVPSDASSIIYVKSMQPGAPASIQVLRF